MARQLRRADETRRGHRQWRRDWFSYESYRVVHSSHIEALIAEGIVVRDSCIFREIEASGNVIAVNLRGQLRCASDVVVLVNKWLDTRVDDANRLAVKTQAYSYHAYRRGAARTDLLRYDNAHGELHRHYFDEAGRELAIEAISLQSLPRLDLVVREAVHLAGGAQLADDLFTAYQPE